MTAFTNFQSTLVLILGLAALACEIFALVDALRHRPDAYVAAGKRTKNFWMILLLVAVVLGVITLFNVLNLFGLVGFIAAAVYLADVRPALRRVSGRGRSHDGPYGPW
jgi:predicted CDP-diglyceride synthetase/phosphatidate cytidylyltransferase